MLTSKDVNTERSGLGAWVTVTLVVLEGKGKGLEEEGVTNSVTLSQSTVRKQWAGVSPLEVANLHFERLDCRALIQGFD